MRERERDSAQRGGTTSAELQRIKALEREVKELRKANEILKLASAFFAQAEPGRHFTPSTYRRYAAEHRDPTRRCARARRDEILMVHIERVWNDNLQVCGADKVCQQLKAERPNQLWVSDFTYVST